MRQIEMMTEAIGCSIFNRETASHYDINDEVNQIETDILYRQLNELLSNNKINEAENLLFDMIDPLNKSHFFIAVDFYDKLSKMTDANLDEHDFSKEEIINGLNKIKDLFNITNLE
jgi:hypothetical protein